MAAEEEEDRVEEREEKADANDGADEAISDAYGWSGSVLDGTVAAPPSDDDVDNCLSETKQVCQYRWC